MVRKCSVIYCNGNYSKKDKRTVYAFPKDASQLLKWKEAIPNMCCTSIVTEFMGVCKDHWPLDAPMISKSRYPSPGCPPSIFPDVPDSCLNNSQIKSRVTMNSITDIRERAEDIDEMSDFQRSDLFRFTSSEWGKDFRVKFLNEISYKDKKRKKTLGFVGVDSMKSTYILQSDKRKGIIHGFTIYFTLIEDDGDSDEVTHVRFEGYIGLKKTNHSLFPSGAVRRWSQLTEVIRFFTVAAHEG